MENYITTMFWLGILTTLIQCGRLVQDHPRIQTPVNIGTDLFALLFGAGMLAWVSYLKFFAMAG